MIEASMLIFMNPNGNYFIGDLDDSNPIICYKTCPKGWMDQTFFAEDFAKPREVQATLHGRFKIIKVDNYTGYNMTRPRQLSIILETQQAILKCLPPCSPHLYQPVDTFIKAKVKNTFTRI